MLEILQNVALSGAALGLVVLILARLMPKSKIREIGLRHGRLSSALGRSKLGLPWEKLETFIEDTARVYFEAFWEGADEDDDRKDGGGTPPPTATGTGGVVAGVIFFLILFLAPAVGRAEILLFQVGRFAVHLPLARVDTTYLYDFATDDADKASRWGGETPIFDVPVPFATTRATIVFGATTDTIRKGEPFVGINHRVGDLVAESIDVGLFAGKRTDGRDWMWGLKASYPLWGGPPKE